MNSIILKQISLVTPFLNWNNIIPDVKTLNNYTLYDILDIIQKRSPVITLVAKYDKCKLYEIGTIISIHNMGISSSEIDGKSEEEVLRNVKGEDADCTVIVKFENPDRLVIMPLNNLIDLAALPMKKFKEEIGTFMNTIKNIDLSYLDVSQNDTPA